MAVHAVSTPSCGSWREIKCSGVTATSKPRPNKPKPVRYRKVSQIGKLRRSIDEWSFDQSERFDQELPSITRNSRTIVLQRRYTSRSNVCDFQESSSLQSVTETSDILSPKALKLEMEIFGDLSAFCPTTSMVATSHFQDITDELNTPVLEKAHFDYDRPTTSSDLLNVTPAMVDHLNYKIKHELSNYDNVNIGDNLMINQDSIIDFKECENKDISNILPIDINNDMGESPIINYIVISGQGINNNNNNNADVFISNNQAEYHNSSINKVTPPYELMNNDEDEYLPTVNNFSDIYYQNDFGLDVATENTVNDDSTPQYIYIETAPYETPDTSRSSEYSDRSSSRLHLNLKTSPKFENHESIETPDIIDTIIENEKGFNLFDFINNEDATTPTTVSLPPFDISTPATSSTTVLPPENFVFSKKTRQTKRKHRDDDDEDYQPPISVRRRTISHHQLTEDSNSSYEEPLTPVKRGRPSKRKTSVTSESTTEGGRYREMRDKNNEASRRSRLKRKVKESVIEVEANKLEDRNMRLKAQVSELERTVNNFRNNLMKILMSK